MKSFEESTMKTAILIAVAFVALSSVPLLAHPSGAPVQQNAAATGRAANAQVGHGLAGPVTSSGSAASEAAMRSVHAELVGRLDARAANEAVVAKKNAKTEGAGDSKGSRRAGDASSVETHARAHAE